MFYSQKMVIGQENSFLQHALKYVGDQTRGKITYSTSKQRVNTGADPAAGKRGGGAKLLTNDGVPGAGPLAGVQGAEPPCVGKFWISELNSRDLVHTFCQHHIEDLLIYFQ